MSIPITPEDARIITKYFLQGKAFLTEAAPPAGFWLKTPDFGLASDKVCEPEIFCASGTLVAQGVLFPAGTAVTEE